MTTSPRRYSWGLLIALLLLVIPLSVSLAVVSRSTRSTLTGISHLQEGQRELVHNPELAYRSFGEARDELDRSLSLLRQAPWYTRLLSLLPPFSYQVRVARAGFALAETGRLTTELRTSFPNLSDETELNALLGRGSAEFFTWYHHEQAKLDELEANLALADQELRAIPTWIIPTERERLRQAQELVTRASHQMKPARRLIAELNQALGASDALPHTYLLLFQNNSELRPSGGFFGSYATLTASGGVIRSFTFGGNIYDLDTAFRDETSFKAPEPLITITPTWGFRDSSVGTAFRSDSAEQVAGFYEAATGSHIDGVIFLDLSVLEAVVVATGPLELPVITKTANAETIATILTQYVERDYFELTENQERNQPKEVFAQLIPFLLEKVRQQPEVSRQIPSILQDAVRRKSVQFWSRHAGLANTLEAAQPLDSPLPNQHWLKIVNTNLGGQKSSRSVVQHYDLSVAKKVVSQRQEVTLTLERSHRGTDVWPDGENRNFTEIYLPLEAEITQLPSNKGGENQLAAPDQERLGVRSTPWEPVVEPGISWKRVRFWTTVAVGETAAFTLRYTLPSSLSPAQVVVLKQGGAVQETVHFGKKRYSLETNLSLEPASWFNW